MWSTADTWHIITTPVKSVTFLHTLCTPLHWRTCLTWYVLTQINFHFSVAFQLLWSFRSSRMCITRTWHIVARIFRTRVFLPPNCTVGCRFLIHFRQRSNGCHLQPALNVFTKYQRLMYAICFIFTPTAHLGYWRRWADEIFGDPSPRWMQKPSVVRDRVGRPSG